MKPIVGAAFALALGLATTASAAGIRTLISTDKYTYRCEAADAVTGSVFDIIESHEADWVLQIYYPDLHNSQFVQLQSPTYADRSVAKVPGSFDQCEAKRMEEFKDKSETTTRPVN